jgi:uncharacterized glyoxalase superfamily protein PhnB
VAQRISPYLYYEDGGAAVAFLCDVLGFVERVVTRRGDGGLLHAEVAIDEDVVMLGTPVDEDGKPKSQQALRALGMRHGSVMCFVDDIDGHYQRACAGGAKVTSELATQSYGPRGYTAEDPEGHVWHFSSRQSEHAG